MTTEIWRVHILWIFQITKITRAKSPIQNGLSGGFQERVGVRKTMLEAIANAAIGNGFLPLYYVGLNSSQSYLDSWFNAMNIRR